MLNMRQKTRRHHDDARKGEQQGTQSEPKCEDHIPSTRQTMKTAKFDMVKFITPDAFYWPGYFLVLNDCVDEERLLRQLRDMQARKAMSVCLLPEPPEFRPVTFKTRMDRPYLKKPYFELIQKLVAECHRLGMNYWLYDEGGWPSGGACGQVYAQNPVRFCRKIAVPDQSGVGFSIKSIFDDGKNAPVPDLLNSEVTQKFIELTHEQYKTYLSEYFGKTILFTFTDEPAVPYSGPGQLTWTDDLAEVFRQRKGYDLLPYLPNLLKEPSDDEAVETTCARVDFFDIWSQLFVERYLIPIRDWCRKNGLVSGGHFGGEDEPRCNADGAGFGHILRALRGLDMPGVDTIWRQTFPGLRSHQFPKYASSVARQMGQPFVLTESFGVYGNGITPGQMKWVTDQQFVRGASLTVICCYPNSTRDHLMMGERPHFGPVNPLWKYMDIYHTYTARLGYLLTRGRAVCSTAVYFDIRSIWAGASARQDAIKKHDLLADVLLKSQCDFDYIDDDLLRDSVMEDGRLIAGQMGYDTIIVAASKWMEPKALQGLVKFISAGGLVIAVDGLPACDGGKTSFHDLPETPASSKGKLVQASLDKISTMLKPLVRIEPACPDIRVCKRTWDQARLYFLTNEADRDLHLSIFFNETGPAVWCDLETGNLYSLVTIPEENGAKIQLNFAPWGSRAILFGFQGNAESQPFIPAQTCILPNDGWTLRPLRKHQVADKDYEIIEFSNANSSLASLGDWSKYLGQYFSGDAEYTIDFDCDTQHAAGPARLDLGNVCYACQVFLNGELAGRRIWKPFVLDLTGKLYPGRNKLQVIVTNTLANTLCDPEVVACWDNKKEKGLWPKLFYDPRARKFEQESLSSGLFGPVRIVFGK